MDIQSPSADFSSLNLEQIYQSQNQGTSQRPDPWEHIPYNSNSVLPEDSVRSVLHIPFYSELPEGRPIHVNLSSTDTSVENTIEASVTEEVTENHNLSEFVINSTISQDQTEGAERNKNQLLFDLAQRLSKLQSIALEKPKENLEHNSKNIEKPAVPRTTASQIEVSHASKKRTDWVVKMAQENFRTGWNFLDPNVTIAKVAERKSDSDGSDSESDSDLSDESGYTSMRQQPHQRNLSESQYPAISISDMDLRNMQKIIPTLTPDESHKMKVSELDPIAYYFAHLKDRSLEIQKTTNQNIIREPVTDKVSKDRINDQLRLLQEFFSPEEQIRILKSSLQQQRCLEDVESDEPRASEMVHPHPIQALERKALHSASAAVTPSICEIEELELLSQRSEDFQHDGREAILSKHSQDYAPSTRSIDLGTASALQKKGRMSSRKSSIPVRAVCRSTKSSVASDEFKTSAIVSMPTSFNKSNTTPIQEKRNEQSRKPLPEAEQPRTTHVQTLEDEKDIENSSSETGESIFNIKETGSTAQTSTNLAPDLVVVRLLQQRIAKLQKEKDAISIPTVPKEASEIQVVYRILCQKNQSTSNFLDEPLAYGDISEREAHLQGQKPFGKDVNLFVERQRGRLSFIAYKDLKCCELLPISLESDGEAEDTETPIVRGSIQVVSKNLQDAFQFLEAKFTDEVEDFPEFKIGSEISSPFLFYYAKRSFLNNLDLPENHMSQIKMFCQYVEETFGEEFARVDALLSQGNITLKYLPYLFEPGAVVISRKGHQYLGYEQITWPKLQSLKLSQDSLAPRPCYSIRAQKWLFEGTFTLYTEKLFIDYGDDTVKVKPIKDLNIFPLRFAQPGIEDQIRERGLTFWSCRVRRFVSYNDNEDRLKKFKHKSDSRYMVDIGTYQKMHHLRDVKSNTPNENELENEAMEAEDPPDGNFLLLLPLTVRGFNMQAKRWVELQVDQIDEVEWNKEAFESLVVDAPVKELITALVTNQLESERATDLMDGKGTGLIVLLHGGPGTGKTLTAESVAEFAEKPLYRVTCGDIGTQPEAVEEYLKTILLLGKTWQCVVLLDEADVFLEQRSLRDLQRNALVSVFLRVLEYYDGILILTSNRVGTFDEAFKSRIQLALHYENLQEWQRRSIWENFIKRLEGFTSSAQLQDLALDKNLPVAKSNDLGVDTVDLRQHLGALAKQEMNGRQIRNAITTARQLAIYKRRTMNYGHLKHVIEVAGKFDRYLFELHEQVDDNQIARDDGVR